MGIITTIIGLFMGPFGKYIAYGLGALFIIGTIFTGIKVHDHNIRVAAIEEFNQKQLEQNLKDKEELEKKIKKIEDNSAQVKAAQDKQEQELQTKHDEAEAFVNGQVKAGKDRPASELLKGTIERLRNIK